MEVLQNRQSSVFSLQMAKKKKKDMEGGTYVLKDINHGMWIHLDLEF